jgi:microcystin degradation protein MlrC
MRIAFGGIHTECSTYSRIRSRVQDFRVRRGPELTFPFLSRYRHEFIPLLHARAVPGGPIEAATYDRFKAEFLDRLKGAGALDGIYLALHGAMFVEDMQDAEGDWLEAVRKIVGPDCLISASYDLHGNLSERIIRNLDMLSAYRTAPHIDVEETGIRACNMLVHCLENKLRPTLFWVPIPALMPGERSSTEDQPAKRLYAQLEDIDKHNGVLDASLLVGYVWADEPRATASAVLTTLSGNAEPAVQLARQYWDAREEFNFGKVKTGGIAECLAWAAQSDTSPVILADSGDNPTGGGVGDRAEVLEGLIAGLFRSTLVAGIADRRATDACYGAGVGGTVSLTIGASLDPEGSRPIHAEATVIFLAGGTDPAEHQAVITIQDITVVLTARRRPFHNITDFSSLGLSLDKFHLLVVKSGYLSPELAPLANPNLMALSDGAINQDIEGLPPNRFRPPTFPFDRNFTWTPTVFSNR